MASEEKTLDETIDLQILAEKYGRISDLWVKGVRIDWSRLYGNVQPRRIPLPTYPFARERYWIHVDEEKAVRQCGCTSTSITASKHLRTF